MTENSTARGPGTPSFTQFISPAQSQSTTPQPPLNLQSAYQAPKQASSDPFAALAGLGSSSVSPAPPSQPRTQPQPQPAAANDDDEWSFSSALPPEPAKPKEFRTVVSSSSVRIEFVAGRSPATPSAMNIHFAFSNTTPQPVGELHFQVAVTKVSSHSQVSPLPPFTNTHRQGYELQLRPQTGRDLSPQQTRGVTQEGQIWHLSDHSRKVDSVKLRWRASYKLANGEQKNEMGDIPEFNIA